MGKNESFLWVSEKFYSISDRLSQHITPHMKEEFSNEVVPCLVKELYILAAYEGLLLTGIEDIVPKLVDKWIDNPADMMQYSAMQSRMDFFETRLKELYDMQSRIMLTVNDLLNIDGEKKEQE